MSPESIMWSILITVPIATLINFIVAKKSKDEDRIVDFAIVQFLIFLLSPILPMILIYLSIFIIIGGIVWLMVQILKKIL